MANMVNTTTRRGLRFTVGWINICMGKGPSASKRAAMFQITLKGSRPLVLRLFSKYDHKLLKLIFKSKQKLYLTAIFTPSEKVLFPNDDVADVHPDPKSHLLAGNSIRILLTYGALNLDRTLHGIQTTLATSAARTLVPGSVEDPTATRGYETIDDDPVCCEVRKAQLHPAPRDYPSPASSMPLISSWMSMSSGASLKYG